jgi:hypothetical protein
MVKAAYESGHPSIGVGAGNTPAVIDASADVAMAVSSILISKTFGERQACIAQCCAAIAMNEGMSYAWCIHTYHQRKLRQGLSHCITLRQSLRACLSVRLPACLPADYGVICASEQNVIAEDEVRMFAAVSSAHHRIQR